MIAVVYVKFDSTHYLNVNEALLEQGVVVLYDFTNNEFNPSSWTLYVNTQMNPISNISGNFLLILLLVAVIVVSLFLISTRIRSKSVKDQNGFAAASFGPVLAEPKYYGAVEGLIIKAIAIDGKHDLSEIKYHLQLSDQEFMRAFYELLKRNELIGTEMGTFDVRNELRSVD